MSGLGHLLEQGQAAGHELVFGELLIGSRPGHDRTQWLDAMTQLAWLPTVPHARVVALVRAQDLAGHGLGWIDAHLLAAALAARCRLWTADEALAEAARAARVGWRP